MRKGSFYLGGWCNQVPCLRVKNFFQNEGSYFKEREGSLMETFFLEFAFPDETCANFAVLALSPEFKRQFGQRSSVSIQSNKNIVKLRILANDKHALKASEHSCKRLLGLCLKLCNS
jgi:tRNA threonylcarbamoyladenosine modification (KEOPS) complex  Pcc1 subunit